MRRSDHPSRPSAITCCRFSALKTLAILAAGAEPTAQVNVSTPGPLAGFQVSINGRFWVSTEDRLLGDEVPRAPVVADAGYGNVTAFRDGLTARGLSYAVGVTGETSVWPPGQAPLPPGRWCGSGPHPRRVRRTATHRPDGVA